MASVFSLLTRAGAGGETEVLLVHNGAKSLPNGKPKPEGWGLPGGSVKVDEAETSAAMREILEETGYEARVLPEDFLDYEEHRSQIGGQNSVYYVYIFQAQIVGGQLREGPGEDFILGAGWFPLNALPREIYGNHVRRIKKRFPSAQKAA